MFIISLLLLRQPLYVIMTRWLRLARLVCAPYRPELRYMRGPARNGMRNVRPAPNAMRLEAQRR
jgi:hypothetical protein